MELVLTSAWQRRKERNGKFYEKISERVHVKKTSYTVFPIYCKVNLATIVVGNPKALFSIHTTPRCRGGLYFFPQIDPLYP